jgi:hypothetical protein
MWIKTHWISIIIFVFGFYFTMSSIDTENISQMVPEVDPLYPGTAVSRMLQIRNRVQSLTYEQLNGNWDDVRRNLLWAGGLRDLLNAAPGQGYTGHCFNDFNHCDLTAMTDTVSHAEHGGQVPGIAIGNQLGYARFLLPFCC